MGKQERLQSQPKWISRKNLANRWDCDILTAARIARANKLRWKRFGQSQVKYLFMDVLKMEGLNV